MINGLVSEGSRVPGNLWIAGEHYMEHTTAAEAFFSTLKVECVYRSRFETHGNAQREIFWFIESFYNRQRRHSALGYLAPVDFENLNN
jgi:transposase InsO family protein